MKLNDISNDINEWFDGEGPHADIVISSRVRLARNLTGYNFLSRCSDTEKAEILEKLKTVLMSIDLGDKVIIVNYRINRMSQGDRHYLGKRIISV